jgi:predicted nucleic acid-binding protein
VTHLVDTSVWHAYARNPRIQEVIDYLAQAGALFTTCPAVIAEYCYSAQTPQDMETLQDDMDMLYLIESDTLRPHIRDIQQPLWSGGLLRAAGASGTLIAAYATAASQTLVTCDRDFLHIAHAGQKDSRSSTLRVLHIAPDGAITQRP